MKSPFRPVLDDTTRILIKVHPKLARTGPFVGSVWVMLSAVFVMLMAIGKEMRRSDDSSVMATIGVGFVIWLILLAVPTTIADKLKLRPKRAGPKSIFDALAAPQTPEQIEAMLARDAERDERFRAAHPKLARWGELAVTIVGRSGLTVAWLFLAIIGVAVVLGVIDGVRSAAKP